MEGGVIVQEVESYIRELATSRLDTIHFLFFGNELPSGKIPIIKKWYYAVLHRSHPRPDGNLSHRGIKVVRRIPKSSRESSSSVKRSAAKFEHLKCK